MSITCLSIKESLTKDSYWLYSAIAKPNMIIKTKKLSIFWNYSALICKTEIPYLPPFYLNHKILFIISLTTGSVSMEDTPAPRRSLSLTPEHIIGPGGCCLQSPGIVETYLEFKVVLLLLLLGHRIRDSVRFLTSSGPGPRSISNLK